MLLCSLNRSRSRLLIFLGMDVNTLLAKAFNSVYSFYVRFLVLSGHNKGHIFNSVDYSQVYAKTRDIMENTSPPTALIEQLGFRIIRVVLDHWALIDEVDVEIQKPQVSLPGVLDCAAVRIKRSRSDMEQHEDIAQSDQQV